MNPIPQMTELGVRLIPLLATIMLVLQLLLLAQRMLVTVIRVFALQSLLLAVIATIVGYSYDAWHVLLVAVLTVIGKVLFLPWLLERQIRHIRIEQEINPWLNMPASLFFCGGLTFLAYLVARPFTSLERLGGNTLAVAVALVLTGFFLMLNRRKALTQVLALLTMENGVMLAAIAFSSYGMPVVVELGIFFDVVIAVMVLGLLVFRIRETFASMDTSRLNELKG
jgi:hydrogenase-4 component E